MNVLAVFKKIFAKKAFRILAFALLFFGAVLAAGKLGERRGFKRGVEGGADRIASLESRCFDAEATCAGLADEIGRLRDTVGVVSGELAVSGRQLDAVADAMRGIGEDAGEIAGGLDGLIERIERFEVAYRKIGEALAFKDAFREARDWSGRYYGGGGGVSDGAGDMEMKDEKID